jgi:hypothetical protein
MLDTSSDPDAARVGRSLPEKSRPPAGKVGSSVFGGGYRPLPWGRRVLPAPFMQISGDLDYPRRMALLQCVQSRRDGLTRMCHVTAQVWCAVE